MSDPIPPPPPATQFVAIPPSTPFSEALDLLRVAGVLTAADYKALTPAPIGVWTWGDLLVVLNRGEISDAGLAKKIGGIVG